MDVSVNTVLKTGERVQLVNLKCLSKSHLQKPEICLLSVWISLDSHMFYSQRVNEKAFKELLYSLLSFWSVICILKLFSPQKCCSFFFIIIFFFWMTVVSYLCWYLINQTLPHKRKAANPISALIRSAEVNHCFKRGELITRRPMSPNNDIYSHSAVCHIATNSFVVWVNGLHLTLLWHLYLSFKAALRSNGMCLAHTN